MSENELDSHKQIEALEAEVNQMHHFINEIGQFGGHNGSITSNAVEILAEIKQILRHYDVYDTMAKKLPAAHKLQLLIVIRNAVNAFLEKYQLTLSRPRPDYDLLSDAAISISDSEFAAQNLELDRYQEIEHLINQLLVLRSQLLEAKLGGKLSTSETNVVLQFVIKINALKNNEAQLPQVERLNELKLLKTKVQEFIDLSLKMKMPVSLPTKEQTQIHDAERTFYNNFLYVVEKMYELKKKLEDYSDIERLTQSHKIEDIQLLYTQLLDCHDQVLEYYRVKSTLRLEKILEYVERIRSVVDEAIKAIEG